MTTASAPRRAIITGGNAGIGRATVLALARRGWTVAFTYNSHAHEAKTTAQRARDLGALAKCAQADFAEPERARSVVSGLVASLNGIDLLVNNAGVNPRAPVADMLLEQWYKTLDINLTSALLSMQVAAQNMKEHGGGCIINVTSVSAEAPHSSAAAYCSSKAALRMLTRVAALELAAHGIRVIDVAPGYTATRLTFGDNWEKASTTEGVPVVPVGRSARPEEVAGVIAFLASDEASYVLGSTLTVDGGLLLSTGPASLQAHTGLPPAPF